MNNTTHTISMDQLRELGEGIEELEDSLIEFLESIHEFPDTFYVELVHRLETSEHYKIIRTFIVINKILLSIFRLICHCYLFI